MTSSSLVADTLTLGVGNAGSSTLSDLIVRLNGVRCTQLNGPLTSFTCKFPLNSLGAAALPAGNNKPSVHVNQFGYADASAVSTINVPLVFTSITPPAVGTNGGVVGTLKGTGFPITKDGDISISLCGN